MKRPKDKPRGGPNVGRARSRQLRSCMQRRGPETATAGDSVRQPKAR